MLKKLFITLMLVTFTASVTAYVQTAAHASSDGARNYIKTVGDEVLEILKEKKSDAEIERMLTEKFKETTNTDWMSRFVLGRYYRQVPKDKLSEYKQLYRDYVIYSYIPLFKNYTGEKFKVTGVRDEKKGHYTVLTEITKNTKEPPIKVNYRVKSKSGSYKVIDIIVEGVSLITTQRNEFSAIINKENFDVLLKKMGKKIELNKS